ncbi:hypothetical protein BGW39_001600 [Mortierella sp. 14UC]|nr:hypothetical protein BGW39_001600 [Mortierella sp. 14UC]
MDPEKLHSTHPHLSKRTTIALNTSAEQPSLAPSQLATLDAFLGIAIPDEPSFILSTSSEASDSGLDNYLSSTPINIPSSSNPSSQSADTEEPSQKPSFDASKPKASSHSSGFLTHSSTPKRPNASGSSSPRPLQFINKSGPPAPRPKPQLPTGVYVQTHSAMQQKARKKIREEGKVKRTSNCFIKYRTHMHPIIVAHFGHQNNKEISRLAGRCWKNEPEEVKSIYRQQAAEEKARHATLYPSYKYTPAKPTPKDDSSSDSGKSKAQHPWNKPTRLSSPPTQLSSSPVSLSSLSTRPELEDKEDKGVESVEDEPTESPSPPQTFMPEKPSASATDSPSSSRLSTERSFVVTETALFDFRGDADLIEKRRSSKNRPGTRPNRSLQRLPGLTDPLSLEISLASTAGASTTTTSGPFTFVLQGPAVSNAPLSAGPKGVVSGLTQALAQQRSESPASSSTPTTSILRVPTSGATSRCDVMSGRLQTSGLNPQQRWSTSQPSPQQICLAAPMPSMLTAQPLNTVFLNNVDVSAGDIGALTTDQNWAQTNPLSPQPPPSFLPRLVSNLVQIPQPSTPIQISVPSVATSQFSGSFSSPVYTSATPAVGARSSLGVNSGFPWHLDANFNGTSDLGLLHSPQPRGSISSTATVLSSTPLSKMHIQEGMMSPSPVLPHPLVTSFEDELASVGFKRELSSSQVSDELFAETAWSAKGPSSMPSTSTVWEYPLLITNQDIAEFNQQLLLSASSSNSSLSLSTSSESVYPEMDISTWTTLGENRVPSPVCIPDDKNNGNDDSTSSSNDNSASINDTAMIVDVTSASNSSAGGDGTVEKGKVITLASQPACQVDSQPSLAWDDEEQLKMSITYYEEIVQQQKMLLNLQRQWRQQAQVVQPSIPSSRLE